MSEPERMHECVWMHNDLRRDMHAEGWTAEQSRRGVGAGGGGCHDAHAHALARQLRAWTCWHRARMGRWQAHELPLNYVVQVSICQEAKAMLITRRWLSGRVS